MSLEGCLLERSAYRKAQNRGYAVTETSYAGLNAKADALIQALIIDPAYVVLKSAVS